MADGPLLCVACILSGLCLGHCPWLAAGVGEPQQRHGCAEPCGMQLQAQPMRPTK